MGLGRSVATPFAGVFFISVVVAQVSAPEQHLIGDWSTRHVIFTRLDPGNRDTVVRADPRAWHSWVEHARYSFEPYLQGEPERPVGRHHHRRSHEEELRADWAIPIFGGVGPWASPAKFGFDVNATPDCTNDYVVFPTSGPGTPGLSGVAPTLVAFNNLYTGPGPTAFAPRHPLRRLSLRYCLRTTPRQRRQERRPFAVSFARWQGRLCYRQLSQARLHSGVIEQK